MKVVETDNHGSDYPYEKLVIAGLSEKAATQIAEIINGELCASDHDRRYWKVTPEDYVLDTEGPC